LVEKKGHHLTIRAFAQMRQRVPDVPARLDIVGEGPMYHELRRIAASLGVSDSVEFWGGVPHEKALALLDRASIMVLPSQTAADRDMEGIPVALIEAMAKSLPVVSTFHSGIPELVEHGISGFLSTEGDLDSLSMHLEQLLLQPALRERMGRAGRHHVQQHFDRPTLVKRLLQYYECLVLESPRHTAAPLVAEQS
jgi:colanic acid/amylovoran biosynthesis glycosyltransferase